MNTTDRVRDYFRMKSRQLVASAGLPSAAHSGLAGSHREEIQRIYLGEVLPRRYGVGRGIVYGLGHRSREADIVIWDELNYPVLPMADHSSYFAESVRLVIESKSRWSPDDFRDVRAKSKSVRDIVPVPQPNLDDAIQMLQMDVYALKNGVEHSGILRAPHHISTAAVFIAGGRNALRDGDLSGTEIEDVDDGWPDALLLLDPGRLVLKEYRGDVGHLLFFELGEDALLAFTNALLKLVGDRSVHTESPFFLEQYAGGVINVAPIADVSFPLYRWAPQRIPLWGS